MPHPQLTDEERERRAKERFLSNVHKTHSCWLWMGTRGSNGYGYVSVNYKNLLAHRYSYELVHGRILACVHVCHRCDNPACVRPSHLFVGTDKDNHADCKDKGRSVRGERNGMSKVTEEQVREMIRLASEPGSSKRAIAQLFGLNPNYLSAVLRGQRWSYLRDSP